jgi:hypothetical protein
VAGVPAATAAAGISAGGDEVVCRKAAVAPALEIAKRRRGSKGRGRDGL